MNKKDIAALRRQLKTDTDLLNITDLFTVYIMKETSEPFHAQHQAFEMLEEDQQELFMQNFKKLLSGQLDEKLFELKFRRDTEEPTQLLLHKSLLSNDTEEWSEQMLEMTEKIMKEQAYDKDIVITFVKGEYLKTTTPSAESEEADRDTMLSSQFMLCSINQTDPPEKEIQFDYIEKTFKYKVDVDPVIDLKKPLGGFLFPVITDGTGDVNRVLYSAGKPNEPDSFFMEEVLEGEKAMTAKEDKAVFEEVVKDVVGDRMSPSTLASVYEDINYTLEGSEEDESPKLDYRDIRSFLSKNGHEVEEEKVKEAFHKVTDEESYELKASSVLPKYNSKSIKISTKVANISVSPQDLPHVRQVNRNGKRYIMIEVEEDAEISGFKMLPEDIE
ncbi:hypothetical protein AAV35_004325 [Salimicrobium jeotgali]|uniref:DUF4317 family protein n=1 Tax=Salimicrobium jeotgali TaxID=1230341 RepID=K2G7U2_9BACI|nr:DUF4317 family protein [Salimicrobium jeotgali]AKG04089.1 hypothetical protein AAV35_004325 [Salimicrobium jeotgali]EKE31208.1 hypothetical protein MJ3_09568 [Salimicrobium jeotgali]MBM7697230.1 hypothetical protein [Salimicrobium jeotgali]